MSRVIYSNRQVFDATDKATSKHGELLQQDSETIRGKGIKEKRMLSYDAIFTFNEPLFCQQSALPFGAGYFIADDGQAEVTQLIGQFATDQERMEWVARTFIYRD